MLNWMAWTPLTATFFIAIAAILLAMSILERFYPTIAREGFLRIKTTRGERLFISLLTTGWINLIWIAANDLSQWYALGIGLAASALIMTKG